MNQDMGIEKGWGPLGNSEQISLTVVGNKVGKQT